MRNLFYPSYYFCVNSARFDAQNRYVYVQNGANLTWEITYSGVNNLYGHKLYTFRNIFYNEYMWQKLSFNYDASRRYIYTSSKSMYGSLCTNENNLWRINKTNDGYFIIFDPLIDFSIYGSSSSFVFFWLSDNPADWSGTEELKRRWQFTMI